MYIDFNTVVIAGHTGYGNASRLLLEALGNLGVFVRPGSDVMLNFCMPWDYQYSKYTIGYTPWESTEVPQGWIEGINRVDQLWSPTEWSSNVLAKVRGSYVHTVPHGIEDCWLPAKRHRDGPFTFLHVGEPAVRKGGELVLAAWHKEFARRKDCKLIYKCSKYPMARIKDRHGSIIGSPSMYDNIEVLGQTMTQPELWELYFRSDCMVYPTRGEGFGLIPFEAMACGLPTILPREGGTGDFSQHSPLEIKNSTWVQSTEQDIHPGLWLDHSVDEIIDLMLECMNNYEPISEHAFQQGLEIHSLYSWSRVAEQVEDLLCSITGEPTRNERWAAEDEEDAWR